MRQGVYSRRAQGVEDSRVACEHVRTCVLICQGVLATQTQAGAYPLQGRQIARGRLVAAVRLPPVSSLDAIQIIRAYSAASKR